MFIISLGGLSESGKSSVGIYLEQKGFCRIKIVNIEKEIMIEKGIIKSYQTPEEMDFDILYANEEWAYATFFEKLKIRMKKKNCEFASIESIYRPGLSRYLKKILGDDYICIYFEVPLEIRVRREFERLKKNACCYSLMEVDEMTRHKDEFKKKHSADKIQYIADCIIDNSLSKEILFQKIDGLVDDIRARNSKSI